MRLLYVTAQNLARPGGARSHVLGFCQGMEKLGVRVKLLSSYGIHEVLPRFRSPIFASAHHIQRLLKVNRDVAVWIRSGWPDVIYYRKGLIDPGYSFAASVGKGRLCVEMNGTGADGHGWSRALLGKVYEASERRKLQKARLIVAVTSGIRDHLLQKHATLDTKRIMVVNNGVNTDVFYPRSREDSRSWLGIDDHEFILLFAGKVARWHGLDVALEAIAALRNKPGKMPRLLIVGEGPALPNLRKRVKELKLEEMVCFKGMVPQEEVASYIGAADVCIAPFTAERNDRIGISPLKIFEYIACGRPVICSDVKGLREIAEEAGESAEIILVRPDDSESLASAIRKIINKQSKQGAARKEISDRVSWSARAELIYRRILEDVIPSS